MTMKHELMHDLGQQIFKNGLGVGVAVATIGAGLTLQDWVFIVTLVSVGLGGLHTLYKLVRDIRRDRRAARLHGGA